MEPRRGTLSDDEIHQFFKRFSWPLVRPCITEKQKQTAIGISKMLWLRLVTGTDKEESVYQDLQQIYGNKHDANISMGSIYFFKMKTALTHEEVRRLQGHYSDDRNFAGLQEWTP